MNSNPRTYPPCLLSDVVRDIPPRQLKMLSGFLVQLDETGVARLLPADNHAAAYPLAFNTGQVSDAKLPGRAHVLHHPEVLSSRTLPLEGCRHNHVLLEGEINFFNLPLFHYFSESRMLSESEYSFLFKQNDQKNCVVINLLDNCYGHGLLKLFNIFPIFNKYHETLDVVVITPRCFLPFLPKDKLNIIVIEKSFNELLQVFNLEPVLLQLKQYYERLEFACLNTYLEYSDREGLISFFNLKPLSDYKPCIVFYARKDTLRRWHGRFQKRNIARLFSALQRYFSGDVDFVILGEKDDQHFPKFIKDERCDVFTEQVERAYLVIMNNSLLTIGVHGSHLILPSLLSGICVHLVPPWKRHNWAEDVVNLREPRHLSAHNNVHLSLGYIRLPGDTKRLAFAIARVLCGFLEKNFKQHVFERGVCEQTVSSQLGFIQYNYPFIRYEKLKRDISRAETFSLRLRKLIYIFLKG